MITEYSITFYDFDITLPKEVFFNIIDSISMYYTIEKEEFVCEDCESKYTNYSFRYPKNDTLYYIGSIMELKL